MKIKLSSKEIIDILINHIDDEYSDLCVRRDSANLIFNDDGTIEFEAEVD